MYSYIVKGGSGISEQHVCICIFGLRIEFIQDNETIRSSTENSILAKVKNANSYADGIRVTHLWKREVQETKFVQVEISELEIN